MTGSSTRAWSPTTGRAARTRASSPSRSCHRGPQGQPQEHPGLGRPDQARRQDRHARTRARRARRSGTSSRPTATSSPGRHRGRRPGLPEEVLDNIVALPGSGNDATTAFESGTGDVLLSYENEAIQARAAGADFDYVVPDQTLLIENPAAVTKDASDAAAGLPGVPARARRARPTTPSRASGRSITAIDGRRRGCQRPGQPVPDAGHAADHRQATSAAGTRPTPSTSTRTTAS